MGGTRFNQDVGSPTNQRTLSVTATAQQITIKGTNYKAIELYNAGPNIVYFGDSTVTNSNGFPLLPNDDRIFKGANANFSIWVVCASAQTATLNIVEYP